MKGKEHSRYDRGTLCQRTFPLCLAVYIDPKSNEASPCIVHPHEIGAKAYITIFTANGDISRAIEAPETKGDAPLSGHWWIPTSAR